MSKHTETGQKPTHELFAVQDNAEGKAFWTKIGAAWPHKDGKGFDIKSMPFHSQAVSFSGSLKRFKRNSDPSTESARANHPGVFLFLMPF